ncbi:MAG: phosphoribosyl-AMP cyclohydrolase [Candidatus Peribacteraceae bacterium]|nr:phosphoribosyl-AMP cyclohydrolase [Candidatus Peribacteraceae bacterium]
MGGLIPAVVQDERTGEILMLAFQDRAAYEKTIETKEVHFFSRSRKKLWKKGETSGNVLHVVEILADCDDDSILIKVKHNESLKACHTGARSCFFKKVL